MRSMGAHMMLPEMPPVEPLSAAPEGWPLAAPVTRTVPLFGTAGASVSRVSRSRPAPSDALEGTAARAAANAASLDRLVMVPLRFRVLEVQFAGNGSPVLP